MHDPTYQPRMHALEGSSRMRCWSYFINYLPRWKRCKLFKLDTRKGRQTLGRNARVLVAEMIVATTRNATLLFTMAVATTLQVVPCSLRLKAHRRWGKKESGKYVGFPWASLYDKHNLKKMEWVRFANFGWHSKRGQRFGQPHWADPAVYHHFHSLSNELSVCTPITMTAFRRYYRADRRPIP